MNAAEIISDDDDEDFEADLKAAQQQMKQKAAKIANPVNNEVEEENMKEPGVVNQVALAHQQYNTSELDQHHLNPLQKKVIYSNTLLWCPEQFSSDLD